MAQPVYWQGSIPWVTAKDFSTTRIRDSELRITNEGLVAGSRLAAPGSTLMLVRGMTLHTDVPLALAEVPVAFNQDVKALRAREGCNDAFIFYWLLANKPRLRQLVDSASHGTGRINTSSLLNLEMSLPPLEEQRAIAGVFSAIDDKIELNRRMGETLEALARTIFRSWFIDFDAVGSKAGGRQPSGMDAETAALLTDSFAESPVGLVPSGWDVVRLGTQIELVRGLSYSGAGLVGPEDDGMPLHNLNSVRARGGYQAEGLKWFSGEYAQRHVVRPGDLLVANTDLTWAYEVIGSPAIVPRRSGETSLFSADLFRVRPLPTSCLSSRYLYLMLSTRRYHDEVAGYSNGTTINHLPPVALQRPWVVLPPLALVEQFESIVGPMFERQEQLVEESATLAELRDTLLPKLISGEIRLLGEGP